MMGMSEAGQSNGRDYVKGRQQQQRRLLRLAGWIGILIAAPFFIWVPTALIGLVPSMVDVFGVVGLRIPASITIGGLLLAAVGFHKF